jgi:hypothetical protein
LADHCELAGFASRVGARLRTAGKLSTVTFPDSNHPFEWLITATSYEGSSKLGVSAVKSLCLLALEEAAPDLLTARARFLAISEAGKLRSGLWLSINRELSFAPATIDGRARRFTFWDRVPDCLDLSMVGDGLYKDEMAIEVGGCFEGDTQALKALGDYLTSCKLLVNNGAASVAKRVIAERTKVLIDALLEVTVP